MPIDFSPLYAPTPESPTSRGLRGIGDALDAVVARRTQMEQARLQREQADKHALMVDKRVRDASTVTDENADLSRQLRDSQSQRGLDLRERGIEGREADHEGRIFDRAVEKRRLGMRGEADEDLGEYKRMRTERLAREAARQQQQAPAAPAVAQPMPDQAPDLGQVQRKLGQFEDWPAGPQPGASPAASQEEAAAEPPPPPAMDITGAVARRAPAPAVPVATEDPLAAVDPALGAEGWEQEMLGLYPDDKEIQRAIHSIGVSGKGRNLKREDMQAAFDRSLARIEGGRDRRDRQADRKEMGDERDRGRRLENEKKVDGIVGEILRQSQFRRTVSDQLSENDLSVIAKGAATNSPMAKLLRGRWAKFGQGAGVLTDHDLATFYESIGSVDERMQRRIQEFLDGTVPESSIADIIGAISALRQASMARANEVGRQIATRLGAIPDAAAMIPTYLSVHTPGYLPIWQAEQELKRVNDETEAQLRIRAPGAVPRGKP